MLMLIAGGTTALPQDADYPTDLTELSLEELMNIEVTSVSKHTEKLSKAASAIFVITQDDIRRSGATSIPEVLRRVPGLQVARINANKWAVTSRGFNGRFANKMLVFIDGRSVYTRLFSGVCWEVQDAMLEDVERIEVIRGPGATLWGANAVNGVINIITYNAADTGNGLMNVGGGSEEHGFGSARFGGKIGDEACYRIYAKYFKRDNSVLASVEEAADAWDVIRSGFRIDWIESDENSLTIQGDIYDGDLEEAHNSVTSLQPPFTQVIKGTSDMTGVSILTRWEHAFSDASNMALRAYYDWTDHKYELVWANSQTIDFDLQHRLTLGKKQELMWGIGYRYIRDKTQSTFSISFLPPSQEIHLFSAFLQDDISIIEDQIRLSLGSKIEHDSYTGYEIQPNARLSWSLNNRHTAWAAVSRAVRTPSRAEHSVRYTSQALPPDALYPGAPTALMVYTGNPDLSSEELLAYELGLRILPVDHLSLDLAVFYNTYDNLQTLEPEEPIFETTPAPAHLVVPLIVGDKMEGETYGVELSAGHRILDQWHLRAAYTYFEMDLKVHKDSQDLVSEQREGYSPQHQCFLSSSMDLPRNIELDVGTRYVDNLPGIDVDSYVSLDIRLGWRPAEDFEIFIVGQNLLDNHHPEYISEFLDTQPIELERAVYGAIRRRFK